MHFDETHQHMKRIHKSSKIFYPFHLTLTFLGSVFPTQAGKNNSMSSTSYPYLNSKHAIAKLIGLLIGAIVLLLAYYAHIDSGWYSQSIWKDCQMAQLLNQPVIWTWQSATGTLTVKMDSTTCPSIAHERVLICSSIGLSIVSFVCIIACCVADIETVNTLRKRDAFFNFIAGVIQIIGGILFIVTPARLSTVNKCRTRNGTSGSYKLSNDFCEEYFIHANKYAAGALGIAHGFYCVMIACILENVKLYGMETPRNEAAVVTRKSAYDMDDPQPPVPPRQSIMRTRRSSVTTAARVKKGVGSFGAVTSHIGNKGASHLNNQKPSGSNEEAPAIRKSDPGRQKSK